MIKYKIIPLSPEAHLFEVKIRINSPTPAGQQFYLPAWIRGSYMIRDFARHLITLNAESNGISIAVGKIDKQTWFTSPCDGPLQLSYVVYAWDLSVRAAHLDITHAYFNGPCVFFAVAGKEQEVCELEIIPPLGGKYKKWQVATGLKAGAINDCGFGIYEANDYEALLDHPFEIGKFDSTKFTIQGHEHRFIVSGRHSADLPRIAQDLEKVCSQHVELFGELPVDDYLFLLWAVNDGYGGLEHRNSTSLMCSRDNLPARDMREISEGYRRLLGLCSHEYFHLWNVKRIMPAVFQTEGTQCEVYTKQLWVFEGITSYYDDLALVRSGVIDRKNYFELLAETITRFMRGSGRTKQTLEESSFDAWTKFYKQDENAPNAIVSYYVKGALFALVLDLHIRLETRNIKSLDDIMRVLWRQHGKTAKALAEGEFEKIAQEVVGIELKSLFDRGVRSTQDLPLKELFSKVGVDMYLLPAQSSADTGRVADSRPQNVSGKPVLGAKTRQQNSEIELLQVYDDGAAQTAGLSAGDLIVAVDGFRLNEKQMEKRITDCAADESITVHAFRRDELMEFNLVPKPAPADTCVFFFSDNLSDKALTAQRAWLQMNGNQA